MERTDQYNSLMRELGGMVSQAGLSPAEMLPAVEEDLRSSADPHQALVTLLRFLAAGFATSFLRDFRAHRVLQQVFLQLAGQSQYLSDILVRTPELLHWLTASGELTTTRTREEYAAEARRSVGQFERLEKKMNALKRYQRRELLRIGAREILGEAPISVTAGELSHLADAVVQSVIEIAFAEVAARTGVKESSTLAAVGLGKLGGEELNFSSDIDLMFVYDRDRTFRHPVERIHSLRQFYGRIVESVVRLLSEHTEEGHLYRIDLRLRPDGTSGPLAISRQSYVAYYESRGESWERQMLLKARIIAGDKRMGDRWLADIVPFVYPRTHLKDPIAEIAEVKRRIEARTKGESNLKLGAGGIRDVEFIVQGMQMVWCGRKPSLRVRNTLVSLEALGEEGLLKKEEQQSLSEAYKFFRMVEHRLQLGMGRQTHSLPESEAETALLARRLHFSSGGDFTGVLRRHRRAVRASFESFFHRGESRNERNRSSHASPTEGRIAALLADGEVTPGIRKFAARVKRLGTENRTLSNLELLVGPFGGAMRSTLRAAVEQVGPANLLCRILSISSRLSSLLAAEPLLLETLVGLPEIILSPDIQWTSKRGDDPRRFLSYNNARIAVRFLAGESSIEKSLQEFSDLTEYVIVQAVHESFASSQQVVVAALGKLGRRELTFGSDADLLILHNEPDHNTVEHTGGLFLRRLRDGYGMDVDLRLRPEGKNAPLVTSAGFFEDYLRDRLELWERQSLLSVRFLAGDSVLKKRIWGKIDAVLSSPLSAAWTGTVKKMRTRIATERSGATDEMVDLKTGEGGLLDIEFALQAVGLIKATKRSSGKSFGIKEALKWCVAAKLLPAAEASRIRKRWLDFRIMELLHRLNSERNDFILPMKGEEAGMIAREMGVRSEEGLRRLLRRYRSSNGAFFNKMLSRCA